MLFSETPFVRTQPVHHPVPHSLTGQYAHSCGMGGLANRGWSLPVPEHLITYTLNQAGYTTALAGFQHVVRDLKETGVPTALIRRATTRAGAEERARAFIAGETRCPILFRCWIRRNASARKRI